MSDQTETVMATVTRLTPLPRESNALIAPGEYTARLLDVETRLYLLYGRSPRAVLWFSICDFGPAFEVALPAYYPVRALLGKPRRRGGFRIGPKSYLARDLAAMTSSRRAFSFVPIEDLTNQLYRVLVRTVTRDFDQIPLSEAAEYSKVARVLGLAKP